MAIGLPTGNQTPRHRVTRGVCGRRGIGAAAALALCLLLSGCARAAPIDITDKTFVADMAPHHALGVRMAAVALQQADDVRVREFGFAMGRYQQAEFDELRGLSDRWHALPSAHIHGMLTTQEEHDLAALNGRAFDIAWLQQMIRHHQGAVAMAADEVASGKNSTAKAIAADIVSVQTKEITQMTAALIDINQP